MSSTNKRKYHQRASRSSPQPLENWQSGSRYYTQSNSALFLEAHEADLTHHQEDTALTLEAHNGLVVQKGEKGSGLINWEAEGAQEKTWVDRYDARLLLTSLPTVPPEPASPELSPSGWSDLPSDAEDTFFFSPAEAEDYHREKRRRLLDRDREERLRTLHAQDGDVDDLDDTKSVWGGSDEEPDDAQRELMRRTAAHILTALNPGQLEMRILANHGADKRFAFLRGRWKRAWAKEKARLHDEKKREAEAAASAKESATSLGLVGLDGYGDSDDGEDQESEESAKEETALINDEAASDEKVMESRRARAREWIVKRRAEKG